MISKEKIEMAKQVFEEEIQALKRIQKELGAAFAEIEETVRNCEGKVILCGMGKSGHIARKIAATLSSLGTPSFYLHPSEAMHGDLGMVSEKDIVLLISNSGETDEIVHILPSLKAIGAKLIALTGNADSTLARECLHQIIHVEREACALNLAPTSSTTAVLVYGDALAVVASADSGFGKTEYGRFHPAGTLGKRVLMKAEHIMATGDAMPVVASGCKITEAIVEMSKKGLGVVAIENSGKELVGILTDGDLRRAIEKRADLYGADVDVIMTKNPKYINKDLLLVDVLSRLRENRLNNYPVVNEKKHVIGMLTWQMIVREGIVL